MPTPRSPLDAYRRDLARLAGRSAFGPADEEWLAASMLLDRYVAASAAERRALAPQLAARLAAENEITVVAAGLRFASTLEDAGALHLSATWLELLERLGGEDRALHRGRCLARRARVAEKLGLSDDALAMYHEVARLGEAYAEPELTSRGWNGIALIAHVRGNFPEARRWYRAAALVADDTGCVEQACVAHQGLLIVAAVARDFDRALAEGRLALAAAEYDPECRAEVLNNVAQVLQDMGQHAAALRGFAAVVNRTRSGRLILAALGGAAAAAAALGRADIVESAAERIARIADTEWPYPRAVALLDLADAYALLGRAANATASRQAALALSEAHGYHELAYRAECGANADPARPPERAPLGAAGARIVSEFAQLEAPSDLLAAGAADAGGQ